MCRLTFRAHIAHRLRRPDRACSTISTHTYPNRPRIDSRDTLFATWTYNTPFQIWGDFPYCFFSFLLTTLRRRVSIRATEEKRDPLFKKKPRRSFHLLGLGFQGWDFFPSLLSGLSFFRQRLSLPAILIWEISPCPPGCTLNI